MTPYSYVRTLLKRELKNTTVDALVRRTDASSECISKIIEGRESARHNTLARIVLRLQGTEARDEFIKKFRNYSSFFRTSAITIEAGPVITNSESQISTQLLDPRVYEVLIYTGCDVGINQDLLYQLLPHRIDIINDLIESGTIIKEGNRFFSSFKQFNPELTFDIIENKINIKKNMSRESLSPTNIFSAEESLDDEGVVKLLLAIDSLVSTYFDVKKNHIKEGGTVVSLNAFVTTFGLQDDALRKIIVQKWNESIGKES